MTLLGVRSRNDPHIRLNPGLHHIMEADDICYYVGFTKEEYSKVREVSPVSTSIWQMCADAAVIALSISGINPLDLDEHNEAAQSKSTHINNVAAPSAKDAERTLGDVGTHRDIDSDTEEVRFFLPSEDVSVEGEVEGGIQLQPTASCVDVSRQNEARRGLQLLRYHSKVDLHALPIVRVNLLRHNSSAPNFMSPSVCSVPVVTEEDTCPVQQGHTHLTFDLLRIEEGRIEGVLPTPPDSNSKWKESTTGFFHEAAEPPPTPRSPYKRSFSDESLHLKMKGKEEVTPLRKGGAMYSSDLSLVGSPTQLTVPVPQLHVPTFPSRFPRLSSFSRVHSSTASILSELDNAEVCVCLCVLLLEFQLIM